MFAPLQARPAPLPADGSSRLTPHAHRAPPLPPPGPGARPGWLRDPASHHHFPAGWEAREKRVASRENPPSPPVRELTGRYRLPPLPVPSSSAGAARPHGRSRARGAAGGTARAGGAAAAALRPPRRAPPAWLWHALPPPLLCPAHPRRERARAASAAVARERLPRLRLAPGASVSESV